MYPISSGYGWRTRNGRQEFHHGVDIACPSGTKLYAPFDCWVQHANDPDGYGWYVNLYEIAGKRSVRWGHLSERVVGHDRRADQGTLTAVSGGALGHPGAGSSTGAHLHHELRLSGTLVDPERYPTLLDSVFDPEVVAMNQQDFRNIIEQELGQFNLRLGRALQDRAKDVGEPTVKRLLIHLGKEFEDVGALTLRTGSK